MLKSYALLTVFTAFSLAQQAECVAAGLSYTFTHDEYYAYCVLINLLGVIGDTTTGLLLFAGIAAAVILVLNVIAAIVVFVTHKKRNPRPPTDRELQEIEDEEDSEDDEDGSESAKQGSAKNKKGAKGSKSKSNKGGKPQSGESANPKNKGVKVQTKEFKFDGRVAADTETLKMATAENPGTGQSAGTKTDLHSVQHAK